MNECHLENQHFGHLFVIERVTIKTWRCRCDCGNEKIFYESQLLNGNSRSCGCQNKKININIGQRFGRLVTIQSIPGNKWRCHCDCGNETVVFPFNLIIGDTKSCGCLQKEAVSVDITGQRFGHLVAISPTGKYVKNSAIWRFRCDCGSEYETTVELVKWKHRTSCVQCKSVFKKEQALVAQKYIERIDGTSVSIILSEKISNNNTSGYKGVTWVTSKQKWKAQIQFKGIIYFLGYYIKIEDAVKARAEAAERLHGPFLEWYEEYKRTYSIDK